MIVTSQIKESVILLPTGIRPEWMYAHLTDAERSRIRAVIIKGQHIDMWREFHTDEASLYKLSDLEEQPPRHGPGFDVQTYESCLRALLGDERTFYLVERSFGVGGEKSVFNHTIRIENVCANALELIARYTPGRIVMHVTPHDPVNWIFGKVAELVGLPVVFMRRTALPWRSWIVQGIDEHCVVTPAYLESCCGETLSKKAQKYIERNRESYLEAMPELERTNLEKRRGEIWSWKEEICGVWRCKTLNKKKRRLRECYYKRKLYLDYCRRSSRDLMCTKFVAFFLHFQPEKSSLPEGLHFTQQWLAIKTLALALPPDWGIVVREHNSTFQRNFEPIVRNTVLYDRITSLENVVLADLGISTFDLIDKSRAVATLTGTVGFQALCRGTRCLCFGTSKYAACEGAYAVDSVASVRDALRDIEARGTVDAAAVNAFCAYVEQNSVCTNDTEDAYSTPAEEEKAREAALMAAVIKAGT